MKVLVPARSGSLCLLRFRLVELDLDPRLLDLEHARLHAPVAVHDVAVGADVVGHGAGAVGADHVLMGSQERGGQGRFLLYVSF